MKNANKRHCTKVWKNRVAARIEKKKLEKHSSITLSYTEVYPVGTMKDLMDHWMESLREKAEPREVSGTVFIRDKLVDSVSPLSYRVGEKEEVITGAAILDKVLMGLYVIGSPGRHHHVIRYMAGIYDENIGTSRFEQGFYTNFQRFVNREEAYKLAIANGQFNRHPNGTKMEELYSEDLW